jgi:hypothetical protein
LRDAGLLRYVTRISSVSGGSVLAAHLVLNWASYLEEEKYETAAEAVVRLTQRDVRGRIFRRWLTFGPLIRGAVYLQRVLRRFSAIPPLGAAADALGDYRDRRTVIGRLESYYEELYGAESYLSNLRSHPAAPELYVLGTNANLASLCSFTRDGYLSGDPRTPDVVTCHFPLPRAVAASSAFPGFFPPLKLTDAMLDSPPPDKFYPPEQYVTDAGVYDNLGVSVFLDPPPAAPHELVVISDATGVIEWETNPRLAQVLGTAIRTIDILMLRSRDLQMRRLDLKGQGGPPSFVLAAISQDDLQTPYALPPSVQRQLRYLRTDLDAFSSREVQCLVGHGYAVMRRLLETHDAFHARFPALRPPAPVAGTPARSPVRLRTAYRFNQVPPDELRSGGTVRRLVKHLARGRLRQFGWWSSRDPLSWAHAFALAAVLLLAGWWAWWWLRKPGHAEEPVPIVPPPPAQLVEYKPHLEPPSYEGFKLHSIHVVIDIRSWKEIRTEAQRERRHSPVRWDRHLELTKVADKSEIRLEQETSGFVLDTRCASHPGKWRVEWTERESAPGEAASGLRKVYQLVIDVSDVPVGERFVIRTESTYWNGMNHPQDYDACMVIYAPCDVASLVLKFPKDKPFKSIEPFLKNLETKKKVEFSGADRGRPVEAPDKTRYSWVVPSPKTRHCYLLKWEW